MQLNRSFNNSNHRSCRDRASKPRHRRTRSPRSWLPSWRKPPNRRTSPTLHQAVSTLDRNQLMSIMLIQLSPGAQIPEHDAGDRAVYALTDSSLLLKSEDGAEVETYLPGQVDVWSVGTYGIENAGDETARFIVVNRTSAPLETAIGTTTAGEAITQPETVTVLHSGQNFEMKRVELMPESTVSLDCDNPCSVFTLTPATLVVDSETGEPDIIMDVFEDRAVWFDGGSTWTAESKESPVGLVVFELKM